MGQNAKFGNIQTSPARTFSQLDTCATFDSYFYFAEFSGTTKTFSGFYPIQEKINEIVRVDDTDFKPFCPFCRLKAI